MNKFFEILNYVLKALAIDEKIGYPEYLGSTNTSELENMYREVRNNSIFYYLFFIMLVYFQCIVYK